MSRYSSSFFPERVIVKTIKNWGTKDFDVIIWNQDEYNQMSKSVEFILRNLENAKVVGDIKEDLCVIEFNNANYKILKKYGCFSTFNIIKV
jgi:hypothetical protein